MEEGTTLWVSHSMHSKADLYFYLKCTQERKKTQADARNSGVLVAGVVVRLSAFDPPVLVAPPRLEYGLRQFFPLTVFTNADVLLPPRTIHRVRNPYGVAGEAMPVIA
jgi:hypothetical protein